MKTDNEPIETRIRVFEDRCVKNLRDEIAQLYLELGNENLSPRETAIIEARIQHIRNALAGFHTGGAGT